MKRLIGMLALCAASAMAADVTGYIIDKNCSTKKAMMGDEACAKSCIAKGAPAVLATDDGKIYKVSNQDKVVPMAGKKVTVTGKLDGDTITVDTIAPSKT
jgi:electron transfer flavoprotein alpha subunit